MADQLLQATAILDYDHPAIQDEGKWINLEGLILDKPYLSKLQKKCDAKNQLLRLRSCDIGLQISIHRLARDQHLHPEGRNKSGSRDFQLPRRILSNLKS